MPSWSTASTACASPVCPIPRSRHLTRGLVARPAVEEDRPFLKECIAGAFGAEAGDGAPDAEPSAEANEIAEKAAAIPLDGPAHRVMVFELDDQPGSPLPVGTVRVGFDGGAASISGFAMMPQWRGKGFGHQVLPRLVRQLLEEGVEEITLDVVTENERALELYRWAGFEVTGAMDYFELPAGALAGAAAAAE